MKFKKEIDGFKKILNDTGYPQAEAARRMNVSPEHLNRVLHGTATASNDLIRKMDDMVHGLIPLRKALEVKK